MIDKRVETGVSCETPDGEDTLIGIYVSPSIVYAGGVYSTRR